jgi:hypothetical protein
MPTEIANRNHSKQTNLVPNSHLAVSGFLYHYFAALERQTTSSFGHHDTKKYHSSHTNMSRYSDLFVSSSSLEALKTTRKYNALVPT